MGWQYRRTERTQRRSIDFHLVEECDFNWNGPMKLSETDREMRIFNSFSHGENIDKRMKAGTFETHFRGK